MKQPRSTVPDLTLYNKNVAEQQKKPSAAQIERVKELFSGPWPQWGEPAEAPSQAAVFMLELRLPNQYTSKTAVLWHRFNYLVLPIPGVVLD